MSNSHQSSIPKSGSKVFGYQAKLLNKSGSGIVSEELGGGVRINRPQSVGPSSSLLGHGKRSSIDVESIRGQWAAREAEANNSLSSLGNGPKSRGGSHTILASGRRAQEPSGSTETSTAAPPTRMASPSQGDSLQRLLHRRTKSYVPTVSSPTTTDIGTDFGSQPPESVSSNVNSVESVIPSTPTTPVTDVARSISKSSGSSVVPLLPELTGSSVTSSVTGGGGEKKFKSSYMARKEAKKTSASSILEETSQPRDHKNDASVAEMRLNFTHQDKENEDTDRKSKYIMSKQTPQEQLETDAQTLARGTQDRASEISTGSNANKSSPRPSSTVTLDAPFKDDDISPTVKAFRERLKLDGPLYQPDLSTPPRATRKRSSLLGEPYWPNPNPVGGSDRQPSWRPSESNVLSRSYNLANRQSPLSAKFDLEELDDEPSAKAVDLPKRDPSPVKAKSAFKSVVVPPQSSSNIYGEIRRPSTLASRKPSGQRNISIGKTDGRQLGKHLPRIVSGDHHLSIKRDEAPVKSPSKLSSTHEEVGSVSSNQSKATVEKSKAVLEDVKSSTKPRPSRLNLPGPSVKERQRAVEAAAAEHGPKPPVPIPASPRKWDADARRFGAGPLTPTKRILPDGRGMQGLVGKGVAIPTSAPGLPQSALGKAEDVTGVKGRVRLSKLARSSTSAALAPAPLPSKRLNMNWMDRQRKEIIAYEYLCHVGEAQQWIEGCLDEELGYGVVEMEESMTDGVALAKLARKYMGEEVVKNIWEVSRSAVEFFTIRFLNLWAMS